VAREGFGAKDSQLAVRHRGCYFFRWDLAEVTCGSLVRLAAAHECCVHVAGRESRPTLDFLARTCRYSNNGVLACMLAHGYSNKGVRCCALGASWCARNAHQLSTQFV